MNISKMTNLYQVTKTLRFSLIPQGKTAENIVLQSILDEDNKRAEEYKIAKKIIDEYHKYYIDRSLSYFKFDDALLSEYAGDYYAGEREKLSDKQSLMMKQISKHLKSGDEYKKLFSKELFKELLPQYLTDDDEKKIIKNFSDFSTYFTDFYKNRENMYSGEGKSTEIAYRIVVQNLTKFLDNVRVWKRISESLPADEISAVDEDLCGLIGMTGNEMFEVASFNSFLSQKGIDDFNTYLGGYTNSDGTKVQGINEKINLYNQKTKGSVPKLKPLYKQILSDRETVSFIPESFSSDNELIESLRGFYESVKGTISEISETIVQLNEYDGEHIYVPAGAGVTELSALAFGSWRSVNDGLRLAYERENPYPSDPAKAEKYLEKQEKDFKRIKSYSISEIERAGNEALALSEDPRTVDFAAVVSRHIRDLVCSINESYDKASVLLSSEYPIDKKLSADDDAISKIKQLLDSHKDYCNFCGLFFGNGDEADKDPVFYGKAEIPFRELKQTDRLYDKVRNYLTSKPFSTDKINLTFGRSNFLTGWAQTHVWSKQEAHLFGKDNNYYLFITSRTLHDDERSRVYSTDNYNEAVHYEYTVQKLDYKNFPRFYIRSKGDKISPRVEQLHLPIHEVIDIYDKGLFNTKYRKIDHVIYRKSLNAMIDYYKLAISRDERYNDFDFKWKETDDYNDISEFYKDAVNSCYRITEKKINFNGLLSLVEDGCGYLFKIYSKDFSEHSHGKPNLHTLYFKMLFDPRSDGNVRLMGNAKIFYRAPSLKIEDTTVHQANSPIVNKNPDNEKATSTFEYDIIKDRRYTKQHFQLHIPVMLNARSDSNYPMNSIVRDQLVKSDDNFVIGIDRGERNLIYVSVIDSDGKIVEQRSLNCIKNEKSTTDYHSLLDKKESDRLTQRREWRTIESIKDLKEGYISQAVHEICSLVIKYRAIVVMENLNAGFKNTRSAVEKSVYQKFEKMLCDKLSFLAKKDVSPELEGGVFRAYQLASPKANYTDMRGQNGIIFYVPAWLTSKIDPTTGFANLLRTKFESVEKSKQFFGAFDSINYNSTEDLFEFHIDYTKFQRTESDYRKKWTVCTNGERIRTFRNSNKNNSWDSETVHLTGSFKELFDEYSVDYRCDDLKDKIVGQNDKQFFVRLMSLLSLTLQMRNSVTGTDIDYLISPVRNDNGEFFDSRKGNAALPLDADANGAYNIARKGLWAIRKLQQSEDPDKESLAITNAEWLKFAQGKQ